MIEASAMPYPHQIGTFNTLTYVVRRNFIISLAEAALYAGLIKWTHLRARLLTDMCEEDTLATGKCNEYSDKNPRDT